MLGEKHPDTLHSLYNLAWSYNQTGNTEKSIALMERLYKLRCNVLGKKHPHTLQAKQRLKEYRKKLKKEKTKNFFRRRP